MDFASITMIGVVKKIFKKGNAQGVIVTSGYLRLFGDIAVYAPLLPQDLKVGDRVWITGKLVATDYVKITSGTVMKFTYNEEPNPVVEQQALEEEIEL